MKKAGSIVLVSVTLLFVGFLSGMFYGKNNYGNSITLNTFPPQTQPTEMKSFAATGTQENTDPTIFQSNPSTNEAHEWRININTATAEELDLLPGIGPVIAQRIIAYREENGLFTDASQLTNVKGIGEATLEKLIDYVILEDAQ